MIGLMSVKCCLVFLLTLAQLMAVAATELPPAPGFAPSRTSIPRRVVVDGNPIPSITTWRLLQDTEAVLIVDNGTENAVQVQVDGALVALVEPWGHQRLAVAAGRRQIRCGSDSVQDDMKPGNVYVYNPDSTLSYCVKSTKDESLWRDFPIWFAVNNTGQIQEGRHWIAEQFDCYADNEMEGPYRKEKHQLLRYLGPDATLAHLQWALMPKHRDLYDWHGLYAAFEARQKDLSEAFIIDLFSSDMSQALSVYCEQALVSRITPEGSARCLRMLDSLRKDYDRYRFYWLNVAESLSHLAAIHLSVPEIFDYIQAQNGRDSAFLEVVIRGLSKLPLQKRRGLLFAAIETEWGPRLCPPLIADGDVMDAQFTLRLIRKLDSRGADPALLTEWMGHFERMPKDEYSDSERVTIYSWIMLQNRSYIGSDAAWVLFESGQRDLVLAQMLQMQPGALEAFLHSIPSHTPKLSAQEAMPLLLRGLTQAPSVECRREALKQLKASEQVYRPLAHPQCRDAITQRLEDETDPQLLQGLKDWLAIPDDKRYVDVSSKYKGAAKVLAAKPGFVEVPDMVMRKWTDRQRKHFSAVLLGSDGKDLLMRDADGKCGVVRLSQLSADDRRYVRAIISAAR